MKNLVTLAVLLSVVVLANGLCQRPTLQHERRHFWEENGKYYSLWYVKINNPEDASPLTRLYLDLHPRDPLPHQLWGLTIKSNRRYTFPSYVSNYEGIQGGNSHEFGYIASSNDASYAPLFFSVYDYACPATEDCSCALVYDPVCGEDGNTYGNQCQARCNGVLKDRNGEC